MKKYLQNLIAISLIFLLLVGVLITMRAIIIRSHTWKFPQEKHILFMGASHVQNGINDLYLREAVNLASASERYMYTYLKLKNILPANPQIDTIYLELAATDLWQNADEKYHVVNEQSAFISKYWPLFSYDEWSVFKQEPLQVFPFIVNGLLSIEGWNNSTWMECIGGYTKKRGVLDECQMNVTKEKNNGYGNKTNYHYLRKIIDLCRDQKVCLYFIETPTYHIEFNYDVDYCKEAYHEYFSDIMYYDFSDYQIDNEYRADGHHLNDRGAKVFTEFLMDTLKIK